MSKDDRLESFKASLVLLLVIILIPLASFSGEAGSEDEKIPPVYVGLLVQFQGRYAPGDEEGDSFFFRRCEAAFKAYLTPDMKVLVEFDPSRDTIIREGFIKICLMQEY
jgi:hypothetical protein